MFDSKINRIQASEIGLLNFLAWNSSTLNIQNVVLRKENKTDLRFIDIDFESAINESLCLNLHVLGRI